MDAVPLVTAVGDEGIMTALVPDVFYRAPGAREIRLQNRHGRSEPVVFQVTA